MAHPGNRHPPTGPVWEGGIAAEDTLAKQSTGADPAKLPDGKPDADCPCPLEGCSEEVEYVFDEATGQYICRGTGNLIFHDIPNDEEV